jgi:EpsI family protein
MSFLNNKYARVLTIVLLLQAAAYYATALRPEDVPVVRPLTEFPTAVSGWQMIEDVKIEPEVLDILKADDTLNRVYTNSSRSTEAAFLFVAFFKSQRYGQTPHSPKNCLPGSGWEPMESFPITIDIPGRDSIRTNRYLVARGDQKSVVLYWYQSHSRIIASEYSAKFWLVADSIRYHRSDSSLVKVVVPVRNGDISAADRIAIEFVQATFAELSKQLPA